MNNESECNRCMHKNVCRYKEAFNIAENMTRKRMEQVVSDEFGSEFTEIMRINVTVECQEFDEEVNTPRPVYKSEVVPC